MSRNNPDYGTVAYYQRQIIDLQQQVIHLTEQTQRMYRLERRLGARRQATRNQREVISLLKRLLINRGMSYEEINEHIKSSSVLTSIRDTVRANFKQGGPTLFVGDVTVDGNRRCATKPNGTTGITSDITEKVTVPTPTNGTVRTDSSTITHTNGNGNGKCHNTNIQDANADMLSRKTV